MSKPTEYAARGFGKLGEVANGVASGIGGAFGKVAGMFLQGGIWGAAAAAVTKAFTWAWEKIQEGAERAARRTERLFKESLSAIKDGAADVEKAFDRAMSVIDRSISRFDAMTNSVRELTKAEIELARQTAIANGMSKADADAAASDLTAQVDFEAEENRLKNIIALEQKRVDAAKDAEAKTAEEVARATAKKEAAESEYQKKREEYVRRNAKTTRLMPGGMGGGFQVVSLSAGEIAANMARAAADFEESDEAAKAREKIREVQDVLNGIKTNEKTIAAAESARAKIENAQTALEALSVRREARELEVQNEIAAKVEEDTKKWEEAETRAAEKIAAEQTRLAEQAEAERMRLAQERYREEQRMERELAAQRISDLRSELAESQKAQGEAQTRQSAAHGSLSTAWGWYRDQSKMQAVIDEQKAQAAAEVQWQKDFDRLKSFRRDWRTADFGSLSAADEAVRQVAFAKEEKAAADRAVLETAENTRNLAEKLDELLHMK